MSGEFENTIPASEEVNYKVPKKPNRVTRFIPKRLLKLGTAARVALALSAAGTGTAAVYAPFGESFGYSPSTASAEPLESPGDCRRTVDINNTLDRTLDVMLRFGNTNDVIAEGTVGPNGRLRLEAFAASNSTARDSAGRIQSAWKDSLTVRQDADFRRDVGNSVNNQAVFCGDTAKFDFFSSSSKIDPDKRSTPVPRTRDSESTSRAGTTNIITNTIVLEREKVITVTQPITVVQPITVTERITETLPGLSGGTVITDTGPFWDGFFDRFGDRRGIPVDVRNLFPEPYQNALAYWAGPAVIALAVLAAGLLAGRRSGNTVVMEDLRTERGHLIEERNALEIETNRLRDEAGPLQNQVVEATTVARNAEERIMNLTRENEELRRRNTELGVVPTDLRRENDEAIAAREAAEAERDRLITERGRFAADNQAVHERLRGHAVEHTEAEHRAALEERDRLQGRVAALEEELRRKNENLVTATAQATAQPAEEKVIQTEEEILEEKRGRNLEIERITTKIEEAEVRVGGIKGEMGVIKSGFETIMGTVQEVLDRMNALLERLLNIEQEIKNVRTEVDDLKVRYSIKEGHDDG